MSETKRTYCAGCVGPAAPVSVFDTRLCAVCSGAWIHFYAGLPDSSRSNYSEAFRSFILSRRQTRIAAMIRQLAAHLDQL